MVKHTVKPHELEQLRTTIRECGLRATPSRIAVLGLMQNATVALTHAEIADKLAGQGWDRTTIYRNLSDFVDSGLLRRTDVGDHVWRFERSEGQHSATAHPHFLCTACGSITCLPEVAFTGAKAPRSMKTKAVEVHVRGVCDACG